MRNITCEANSSILWLEKTPLDRDRTDSFSLTCDLGLDLQSPVCYDHDQSHAKVQAQWSVGSEDRVEVNGQTDGGNYITFLANAVGNEL